MKNEIVKILSGLKLWVKALLKKYWYAFVAIPLVLCVLCSGTLLLATGTSSTDTLPATTTVIAISDIAKPGATAEPSATVEATATAAATLTQAPTRTQAPTSTQAPSPTADTDLAYRAEIVSITDSCAAPSNEFIALNQQLGENISLIRDDDWIQDMVLALVGIKTCGEQLQEERTVPPGYAEADRLFQKAGAELVAFVKDYANGIDTMDADLILQAVEHIKTATKYISEATKLIPAR